MVVIDATILLLMIAKGYAEHDAEKEGLRITNKGRAFLASLSD